jgi:hypothetical protein
MGTSDKILEHIDNSVRTKGEPVARADISYCSGNFCSKRHQCYRWERHYRFNKDAKYIWISSKPCIENNHYLFWEMD